MSHVHITTPRNRLAQVLEGIGGRTIDDLSNDAEARVEQLAGAIRDFARRQVEHIMDIQREGEIAMFSECRRIASLAMNVAETAGAAQMHALGEAARGVYAIIQALVDGGVWHTEALDAHIQSTLLLASEHSPGENEAARMIASLRSLRGAIGISD